MQGDILTASQDLLIIHLLGTLEEKPIQGLQGLYFEMHAAA
jgi:hypothetical protein